jgi:hypothetical protein
VRSNPAETFDQTEKSAIGISVKIKIGAKTFLSGDTVSFDSEPFESELTGTVRPDGAKFLEK